jgi:phage gpG-like protein
MGLRRKAARAIKMFSDFTPEMKLTGDWLITDAKQRLSGRNSEVSIGRLAKSLNARAYRTAVTIFSVLAYARVQQEGGEIRPKKKYLAIPLNLSDRRAHVWPRMISGQPGVSLRFVPLGPDKALLIYSRKQVSGKRHKAVAGYARWLLLRKVKIPARPYLVKSAELIRYLQGLLAEKVRKADAA